MTSRSVAVQSLIKRGESLALEFKSDVRGCPTGTWWQLSLPWRLQRGERKGAIYERRR